jgi:hypothetical protein
MSRPSFDSAAESREPASFTPDVDSLPDSVIDRVCVLLLGAIDGPEADQPSSMPGSSGGSA